MPASNLLPDLDLSSRIALVTGASEGIGAAVSESLAAAGAEVVLIGRRAEPLAQVAERIELRGGRARAEACDVTDSRRLREVIADLSRLDILVNNAGTNYPQPFLDVTEEALDAMLTLNVRAAFICAQASTAKMLEHPGRREIGGAIVNMSSQMGHVGSPERTVYCATKHAIEGLTKAMAVELAPQNIRVNAVGPTFTETPLVQRVLQDPARREALLSRIPLGRVAEASDIAHAVLYLASPAGRMITGTHLLVDGGWTAQ